MPFAFAIGALATGRLGEGWLLDIRRWTLYSWGLLTVGIVLGSWWAYEVLGWGGFWGWDPVESTSFLPWRSPARPCPCTSVLLMERRRRMLPVSDLVAGGAVLAHVLGAFLTRCR